MKTNDNFDLTPMRNCPGAQRSLNWMPGYQERIKMCVIYSNSYLEEIDFTIVDFREI